MSGSRSKPLELDGTGASPADVVGDDVVRVVKLWARVFNHEAVTLKDAVLVLRRLARSDDFDATRLGETLARTTGRPKWNSQAVGRWLMRASKYRVSGRWIRRTSRGWRLEEGV